MLQLGPIQPASQLHVPSVVLQALQLEGQVREQFGPKYPSLQATNCQLLYSTFYKHWTRLAMNKMTLINWLTSITQISRKSILTTTYTSSINVTTSTVIQTMPRTRFVTLNSKISRKTFWKSIYLWSKILSLILYSLFIR